MGKYDAVPGSIPGTKINLGGVELTMAPLNLDGVKSFLELQPELAKADGPEESFRITSKLLLLSLARNYPDMTEQDVLALLDTANAQEAMAVLGKLSGLKQMPAGEPQPASR